MTTNPAGLPYEVTQVVEATDTQPETRSVIAAFAEAAVADWFTDQLRPAQGVHFETPGLVPPGLEGVNLSTLG